jgi:hypothetical protein
LCHIKETRSEQLTDTSHFSHKNIIKPMITRADKIMVAITKCVKTIKAVGSEHCADEMEQLQHLTERAITPNAELADKILRLPTEQTHGEASQPAPVKGSQQESPDPNQ